MTDRFEDEMEDLLDAPEGHALDEFDEADEFDGADEADEADEFDLADDFDGADELDALDEANDALEESAGSDEFEEAMTDALEAADTDEFFGKIGGFLKKIGRGVGSVARVVAPLASAIPLPQAQLIGRAAGLIGNVLADEGDELDAFEDMADYAEDEDALDAMAPAVATLAIRTGFKHKTAQIPRPARRALVKTVTAATRHLVRKHGPRAVQALPAIMHHVHRTAVRKGIPTRHIPHLIKRAVKKVAKSPATLRKYVRVGSRLRAAHFGHRARHGYAAGGTGIVRRGRRLGYGGYGGGMVRRGHRTVSFGGGTAACPSCGGSGRRRSWRFDGPVRVTIQSV